MISVLIPSYNNAQFIMMALASALNIKNVKEIIIIDDASDDNTEEIIKNIKKKENKIIYKKNPVNLGTGRSYLKALNLCNQDYILMLNSDDFFIPEGIDKLYQFLTINKLDLAYGKMAIQKKKKIFGFNHPGYKKNSYIGNRNELEDLLIYDMYMPSFGTIIKRTVLSGFYNTKYIDDLNKDFGDIFKAHDYDLFLNLAKRRIKIGFLNDIVCVWNPKETSQSGDKYFTTGCAAAESAFLFNRYYTKNENFGNKTLFKIKQRIQEKLENAICRDNLDSNYKKHLSRFFKNIPD